MKVEGSELMKVKELLKLLENENPEGELSIIADGRRFVMVDKFARRFNSFSETHDITLYGDSIIVCEDCKTDECKYNYYGMKLCGQCLINRRK